MILTCIHFSTTRIDRPLICLYILGPFKKTYKRYIGDPSVAIPRSTKHSPKRCKTTENPPSQQSFDTSSHFKPAQEGLSPEFVGSFALTEGPSFEISHKIVPQEVIPDRATASEDSDSDISSIVSSAGESDVDSEGESTSSDESEVPETAPEINRFSDQENICMAVLSFVIRHRVTAEAAKDLIDLVKVTCPERLSFQSLNYSKVQEVCGKCEILVHDICDKCLRRLPQDAESFVCSTVGCEG